MQILLLAIAHVKQGWEGVTDTTNIKHAKIYRFIKQNLWTRRQTYQMAKTNKEEKIYLISIIIKISQCWQ